MSKQTFRVVIPDYKYWRQNIRCQTGCPVNTDSRGYVMAIAEGDYEKAYWIARIPNPLASICGRVCGAPCELACRRKEIDAAISIRALKRFVTEKYGVEIYQDKKDFVQNFKPKFKEQGAGIIGIARNTSKPVSIVGSGPAGLACAHDLVLMGYKPIIYEMENVAGGMCALGIPPYRLPREILQAEIDAIKALGVEIRLGVQIGKDIPLKKLYEDSSAVLLSVGAKISRMLSIEGANSKGVFGGVDFLRDVFTGKDVKIGAKVVVIGGGNVAMDSARTALRLGAEKVHVVYRRTEKDMPSRREEVEEAKEEGIEIFTMYGPHKINTDENNTVKSVVFKRCISLFDSDGNFNPTYDEFDTLTIPADTVFLAIGQTYDFSFLKESGLDIEMTQRGTIKVKADKVSTSVPGLFVAGDFAHGPKLVIDAIASGKRTAIAIHEYISGKHLNLKKAEAHMEFYSNEVAYNEALHLKDYEKIKGLPALSTPIEGRKKSILAPVEIGFTKDMAEGQGGRCLNCAVNTIFNGDRCILCGGCADVCPEYCLRLVSLENIKGDEALSALYKNRYGKDPAGEGSAIIKDEERCIRCSLCVKRCPVNAITMERFVFKEVLVNE